MWSKKWPFAFAHLDRVANDGEYAGIPSEIKTAAYEGDWGPSGTDEIPAYYYPQIQHQLAVTEKPYAYVFCLILSLRDLRVYKVARNDIYIAKLMKAESIFWDHVLDRVPPDPINASDIIAAYPSPDGVRIIDDETLTLVAQHRDLSQRKSTIEATLAELRDKIALAFEDASTLVLADGGKIVATFKGGTSKKFDAKRLADDEPETHAKYVYETAPYRTLLVKPA